MATDLNRPEGGRLTSVNSQSRPPRRAVLAVAAALVFSIAAGTPAMAAQKNKKQPPATMLPIQITNIALDAAGNLVAHGTVGSHPFTAPVTLAPAGTSDDGCPILNLQLGPIHLDLLGLIVDTSPICLDITANPGPGNLLGNLLCGVAGLLDGGLDLGDILGGLGLPNLPGLTNAQAAGLLQGLVDLLNGALGAVTNPAQTGQTTAVSGTQAGACDILNLSLAPIHLNLLGLEVDLDNCNNGPVTVDITANPAGGLLGNLLCNLAGLLDGPANGNAIANALNRVADAITQLVGVLG